MRFLITGITGFAGPHLATRLHADGHDVFGIRRGRRDANADLHLTVRAVPAEHLIACDLTDPVALTALLRRLRPDGVFHLAALTSVPQSFAAPEETYRTNLLGTLHLFAAARAAVPACRIVWIGSSEAYGQVAPDELPIDEQQPFRPLSPYAVSKAAADLAAYQWAQTEQLDLVRVRPFNHTGPGQAPHFICADFARQVVAVERGLQPSIEVGNLDTVRDFSDVRDVVRAYVLAWERGKIGEAYNVSSGIGRTPRQILDDLMRLAAVRAVVGTRPERQRPIDVPAVVGNAEKLRQLTGWSPTIAWEQTLADLLDDWRQRLAR